VRPLEKLERSRAWREQDPASVEEDLLMIFRKHMSGDVHDHIYVPGPLLRDYFKPEQYPELRRLKKKYKIWVEEVFGVKHWVMNPLIETVTSVEILSLIRQVCTDYDKLKPMPGEFYGSIRDATVSDDDIPF
jgi:hypothetical protein